MKVYLSVEVREDLEKEGTTWVFPFVIVCRRLSVRQVPAATSTSQEVQIGSSAGEEASGKTEDCDRDHGRGQHGLI